MEEIATIGDSGIANEVASLNDDLNIIIFLIAFSVTILFFILYFKRLKSKQLLNYIPNVWTSLGILGTFIAIVTSLSHKQTSSLSDVDTLVQNIIPAFTTSIIGIIGAVIFSMIIKIVYAIEEKKENEQYLKEVGGNIMPEILLKRILNSLEHNTHFIEKLTWASQQQEKNIKGFLNEFLSQLNTFYDRIFEMNKEQVQTLSDEYVHNVSKVLAGTNKEINKRIDILLLSHSQTIQEYLKAEKEKLDEVANQIKSFLKSVPDSVDDMKVELIDVLRNTIIEKYNQLLEGNDAFTTQLLERVKVFENELSRATTQQCADALNMVHSEIQRIITLLKGNLQSQSVSIEKVSTILSTNINSLISSVNKSTSDYEAMVKQLDKLIPVVQREIEYSEKSVLVAEQNSKKLAQVLITLEDIVKKNQQLRYELTQWKRVHKKVKINNKTGAKECPNCGAENPMDANFCRQCNCGFWNCETIASSLK